MRFVNHLNCFSRCLRLGGQGQRLPKVQSRLCVEQLEDRMVPSTLFADAFGNISYLASPGAANSVTLSERLVLLAPSSSGSATTPLPLVFEDVITDTAETINVTGPDASHVAGNGTHQVTFLPPKSIFVDLSAGNEVVNVRATNAPTLVRHEGTGVATVNVGDAGKLQGIQASLLIQDLGAGGSVRLHVVDSADAVSHTNVRLTGGTINNLAPAEIDYSNLNSPSSVTIAGGSGNNTYLIDDTTIATTLNTGCGSNQVNVQRTVAPLKIQGHGGTDTVTVGSQAPLIGGTQAGILGAVTVRNTTNSTALVVDDRGDPFARSATVADTSVQFAGIGSPIHFLGGVKSVQVFGGTNDTFFVQTHTSTTPVSLLGGFGFNTIVSGAGVNDWTVTGINRGTLRNVTFNVFQDLRGGAASVQDTFHFDNGAAVSGSIVGGGPSDTTTLDYSKYTTPVTVNLKTNAAVAGGLTTLVFNIQDVLGGSGNNILVGNGNNVLRGGSGRDLLVSGGGTSTLQAGSGEAVLIGAHYLFDTNVAALNAIMAEWSHTYDPINPLNDYQVRVGHLEHGGGLNGPFLLNPGTVVPQPGHTTLTSGAGLDFLIFDSLDTFTHPVRTGLGEVALPV
jgi:hypothetical protein